MPNSVHVFRITRSRYRVPCCRIHHPALNTKTEGRRCGIDGTDHRRHRLLDMLRDVRANVPAALNITGVVSRRNTEVDVQDVPMA